MLKITVDQFAGEDGTIYGVTIFDGRDFFSHSDCDLINLASTVFTMVDQWEKEKSFIEYSKSLEK